MLHQEGRFPNLRLPWVSLGLFPTPARPLSHLQQPFPGTSLWVKDDGVSGEEYGGNKVRKLEFILANLQERGIREQIVFGGIGSNQVLASALYGRKLGIATEALVIPQPPTAHVRKNLLWGASLGVRYHFCRSAAWVPMKLASLALGLRRKNGQWPAVIPPGASSVIGNVGYVKAAFELKEQIDEGACPEPDVILVAAGSLGTFAGLVVGARLAGLKSRVLGVRVVDKAACNSWRAARMGKRLLHLLRNQDPRFPSLPLGTKNFPLLEGSFGQGYGAPTPEGHEAVEIFREDGVLLETTYTGKAAAGMIGLLRSGSLKGQTCLFWNTANARQAPSLDEGLWERIPQVIRVAAGGTAVYPQIFTDEHRLQFKKTICENR